MCNLCYMGHDKTDKAERQQQSQHNIDQLTQRINTLLDAKCVGKIREELSSGDFVSKKQYTGSAWNYYGVGELHNLEQDKQKMESYDAQIDLHTHKHTNG